MKKCIDALDDAIGVLEEMKAMLKESDPTTPLSFFEASQDVHYHLTKAVSEAITPLLTINVIVHTHTNRNVPATAEPCLQSG